jgi:hypothetical protein
MKNANASFPLVMVAIIGLFPVPSTWAGPAKPTPPASDPVEDAKQVEALLDQRDQKMLAQLRANRQNEILYYKGRKRSEIMKALGLPPPDPGPKHTETRNCRRCSVVALGAMRRRSGPAPNPAQPPRYFPAQRAGGSSCER